MIDALELHNFKAFREERFDFCALTLLAGLNGSGKSSVLQSLAVLRQSWEAGTLDEQGLLLNGDLIDLGTGRDVLHEDYATRGSGGPQIEISLESGARADEWVVAYERDSDLLEILEATKVDSKGTLFHPGFQYIRADRIIPAVTYPRSYDRTVRKASLGSRGEHTPNFLRTFADQAIPETRRHSRAKSTALLDQTNAWLEELCPGVNIEAHEIEGTDFVRLDYGFFGTAGIEATNRYRPTNVGFGLTYVLPIIVACLTSQSGSIILLENPEAHLHPRGQATLARLCALASSDGVQIIVESHSDHFLNGIRLSVKAGVLESDSTSILFFERPGHEATRVTRPRIGGDGMLSNWPKGFFDEWDEAVGRLLE